MFGKAVPLVRISGIQIRIDPSWVLIAALIIWSLSTQYFPIFMPTAPLGQILALSAVGALGLFASLTLHELGHSVVARHLGLEIRGITLFLFGGVAELGSEPRRPRDEFWIAVAGPAVSLVLALLFGALTDLAQSRAGFAMWTYLSYVNWALALFNLIPAFPMDGGRVLRAGLWARSGDMNRATATAALTGTVFGLGLIGLGLVSVFGGGSFGGFWTVLIGFFVFSSARNNHAVAKKRIALGRNRIADLMSTPLVKVPPEVPLSRVVHEVMLPRNLAFVPVFAGAEPLGVIDREVLQSVPQDAWAARSAGDVMRPVDKDMILDADMAADMALDRMLSTGRRRFLVRQGDRITGVLSASDLMPVMSRRAGGDPT